MGDRVGSCRSSGTWSELATVSALGSTPMFQKSISMDAEKRLGKKQKLVPGNFKKQSASPM